MKKKKVSLLKHKNMKPVKIDAMKLAKDSLLLTGGVVLLNAAVKTI